MSTPLLPTASAENGSETPETEVVLLGTSGGPRWWSDRAGIATAIVVGDDYYLVDCGSGLGRQLHAAGLPLERLRGVFVTHLHSDHVVDLAALGLFGTFGLEHSTAPAIPILGPGDRGAVVPVSSRAADDPGVLYPDDPTPGIARFWEHSMRAAATDLNDRYRDSLHPAPDDLFAVRDIELPAGLPFHPDRNPAPEMEPFVVHSDEQVTVTAVLVEHRPVAPAYAFRFDTPDGSVTVSGDTAPCDNLLRLAAGTDVLLHEVIDQEWITEQYGAGDTPLARTMIDHHAGAHTSIPEAGRIAETARAGTLVLHHFVPGNRPRHRWETVREHCETPVIVGEDLMRIPVRALTRTDSVEGARA